MADSLSLRRHFSARPLAAAALVAALLAGAVLPTLGSGAGDSASPPSRVPLPEGQPAVAPPPPVLTPADLGRAAAHAPPAVAALYRALARADPEAASPSYEEMALKKIGAFLGLAAKDASPHAALRAGETALAVVLRYHLGAHARPLAGPNPWAKIEGQLRQQLLDVRLRELRARAASARDAKAWAGALARAGRLVRAYPGNAGVLVAVARVRTAYAGARLLARDYAEARRQVEWVEAHFLRDPTFEPLRVTLLYRPGVKSVRRALEGLAKALLKEARSLEDDSAAVEMLRAASAAWPYLPGLPEYLLERRHVPAVLHVGVASLPQALSPATARTDSEKQALELLFEGLVQERYDDARGERYVPRLADGPPAWRRGGVRFALNRRAFWSSGQRVSAADVRDTVQLLKDPRLPGRTPEWRDLVEDPVTDDPFHIDFRFRQPVFDPLAPLTFKVLPPLTRADDPSFARKPVGSGPYQYAGTRKEGDRLCAVFTANPYYARAGRPGRPFVREIRFYVAADPVRDFRDAARPLHLLLDLPTVGVTRLRDAGVQVRTLRNRRVHFLALNHKEPALADANLRRAFAHALDRERILTLRFRGGEPGYRLLGAAGGIAAAATLDLRRDAHPEAHRTLNGPYPAGSWACCPPPAVPAELYAFDRAVAFARKAPGEGKAKRPALELTLKYPAGDARVEAACRDIAAQLGALGAKVGWPVRIRPMGLPPHQLSADLEQRSYQLAYHHLDYTSEAYGLWPLFDPRPEALAKGGANFLGYEDADLEDLFRRAMGRRDFAEVRKQTHAIHAHLYDRMPLIPLWQLDTHVALHSSLRPTHLDPLRIFDDVANWKLGK